MSKLISLRLDEDLVQRLDSEASLLTASRGEEVSRSTVIAIAVARYFGIEIPQDLERHEKPPTLDTDLPEKLPFRCRFRDCGFEAGSEGARCPHHAGKLVPNV